MKKIINIVFSVAVVAILAINAAVAVTVKKDVNKYENRTAEKFEKLTGESFSEGNFQTSFEAALCDRVCFAENMKKLYNDAMSIFLKRMITSTVKSEGVKYIKLGDRNLIGDNIVWDPSVFEWNEQALKTRADLYNGLKEKHPDKEFYLYYIEKDTDINFETGEKLGAFECLRDNLEFDADKIARFEVSGFEDYRKYFFKTDHHWNHEGSYKAYTDLVKLFKIEDEPLQNKGIVKIADDFSGSKATGETEGYKEEFWGYKYDFPEMKVTLTGYNADDYGQRDEYNSGKKSTEDLSYTDYYGYDEADIVLDTGNEQRENILIIGESYDNAVLKLIASHFHRTHCVDLRGYARVVGRFSLSDYIEKNDIDKIVFMGNLDYIVLDEFIVED